MTGGVITLMSCKPLWYARMCLLCFQVVHFRDNSRTSLRNFATWCPFMLCRFLFSRFIMQSQRNRKKFWARLKEKIFAYVGKWLELLESREVLCVNFTKLLNVSTGRGYKILRVWIRCLYKNLIDCLCVATNQSTNDQRGQTLQLDTSQLVLNQDPTVC